MREKKIVAYLDYVFDFVFWMRGCTWRSGSSIVVCLHDVSAIENDLLLFFKRLLGHWFSRILRGQETNSSIV